MSGETIEDLDITLDADGWRRVNLGANGALWNDDERLVLENGRRLSLAQCVALLALRDKVAALINVGHREYFVGSADIREAMSYEWLRDTLRVVDEDGEFTDFGQEICRVLRETSLPENVDEDGLCELCGRVHGTGEYMCPEPDGDECLRYGSVVYGQPPGWSEEVDAAYEVVVQHMAKRGLLADGTTPRMSAERDSARHMYDAAKICDCCGACCEHPCASTTAGGICDDLPCCCTPYDPDMDDRGSIFE